MARPTPRLLAEGLEFPESPRWHEGRLWFCDSHDRRLLTLDSEGNTRILLDFNGKPSGLGLVPGESRVAEKFSNKLTGLGFLPGGAAIFGLNWERLLVRYHDSRITLHADLRALPGNQLNDMVTDGAGTAYVDLRWRTSGSPLAIANDAWESTDCIVAVDASGTPSIFATGLITPNGLAIGGDGQALIVAETRPRRVTSLPLPPAAPAKRRLFAALQAGAPDGLCVDAEGAVWVGTLDGQRFLRIKDGGTVTHAVETPGRLAAACTLGGPERKTLFMCTAVGSLAGANTQMEPRTGGISSIEVAVPGAGFP